MKRGALTRTRGAGRAGGRGFFGPLTIPCRNEYESPHVLRIGSKNAHVSGYNFNAYSAPSASATPTRHSSFQAPVQRCSSSREGERFSVPCHSSHTSTCRVPRVSSETQWYLRREQGGTVSQAATSGLSEAPIRARARLGRPRAPASPGASVAWLG